MQTQRYVEDVSTAINYIQVLSVVNPSAVQSDKSKQLQEWLSLYPKVKQDVHDKKQVDAKKAEEAHVQIFFCSISHSIARKLLWSSGSQSILEVK